MVNTRPLLLPLLRALVPLLLLLPSVSLAMDATEEAMSRAAEELSAEEDHYGMGAMEMRPCSRKKSTF